MKRLAITLSTLTLLLVAAPVSAMTKAEGSCKPDNFPEHWLLQFTAQTISEDWHGPLCLKSCKAHLAGCKKVSASVRKCKHAASKAIWKASIPTCQLHGFGKKACVSTAKVELGAELGMWKDEFLESRFFCEAARDSCKAACAP
jgi:hypothetical protein